MNVKNIKELRDLYEYNGLHLLDDKIGNTKTKHKCRGGGNYLYYLNVDDVKDKRNKGHSIVSKFNPYSIQNIQQFIYNNGSKTKVLSPQYISNKTKIKFKCECGREYSIPWNRVLNLRKVYCNHCGYKYITETQRTSVSDLRKEVRSYGYDLVKGVEQCSKSLTVINEYGDIFHTTIYVFRKGGLPTGRRSSSGEILVGKYLMSEHIKYETQKTFKKCRHINLLRFDFYLPKYKICIEVNGKQHYEPIEYFGGKERFETQRIRDNIKRKFCEENNIKLLEIPYWEMENKTYKTHIKKIIEESI